nr:DUF6106 family protein [uncultured Cellulosilyticum sp.]
MMQATFKEYMIKQKKSAKDITMQALIVVCAAVIILLAMTMGGAIFGPIITIAALLGAGYLFIMFSREYEYILTNEELDIDVIYNRSKRKRVTTVNLRKIDVMAAMDDANHRHEIDGKGVAKVINASDNSNDKNTYVIIGQTQFGATKIILSPSEDFLDEMFRQSPNKIFRRM